MTFHPRKFKRQFEFVSTTMIVFWGKTCAYNSPRSNTPIACGGVDGTMIVQSFSVVSEARNAPMGDSDNV